MLPPPMNCISARIIGATRRCALLPPRRLPLLLGFNGFRLVSYALLGTAAGATGAALGRLLDVMDRVCHELRQLLNPEVQIPSESRAIHGISDEQVRGE